MHQPTAAIEDGSLRSELEARKEAAVLKDRQFDTRLGMMRRWDDVLPRLGILTERTRAAIEEADPTAILLAEHDWLREVLAEYRAPIGSWARLGEIHADMLELKPRLESHIRREEEAYFPAIEDFMQESGQGSVFDMYGEHDAIRIRLDELLAALEQQSMASSAFGAFARSLLIHFENEEELIFAEAPQHLTAEARREILRQFAAMEAP